VIPLIGEQSTGNADVYRSEPQISGAPKASASDQLQHRNCLQRRDKLPYAIDHPLRIAIADACATSVVIAHNATMTAPEEETCSMLFDVLAISRRGECAMRT
jgi:hypothetical protein